MRNGTESLRSPASPQALQMLHTILETCFISNKTHSTFNATNYNNETWCPRIFDGFLCWDHTPGGVIAHQKCPTYLVGFDPKRTVYKSCLQDGTWSLNPETLRTWTNYTTCVDMEDLSFRRVVNAVYIAGYSVSIIALIAALATFLTFKTLQCTRNWIHVNLFFSFLVDDILWIIWYTKIVNTAEVVQENLLWCQGVQVAIIFFMVSGYFWMFVEGLHLHLSLVVVFVRDSYLMRIYCAVGWGIPLVITSLYTGLRYYSGNTERCWTDDSKLSWIINVPVVISLAMSFVFLVNVVRVLCTKARPHPGGPSINAAKKATRAALILIPLFGLHFILIPLRPSQDVPWEKTYQIIAAFLTSFQGFCVTVLFCFTNHEVINVSRRQMSIMVRHTEDIPMTGMGGGGESAVHTRENIV